LSALAKAPVSGPQIAKKLKRTPGRFRRRRLHWGFVFAAELLTPWPVRPRRRKTGALGISRGA